MNIDEFYPSPFLKHIDVRDHDLNLTIKRVVVEELGQDRERKPVMHFADHEKKLVLNKTNMRQISSIHGPNTDSWVGKGIGLYGTTIEMAGTAYEVVRVRPKAPVEPHGDDPNDPIGF